MKKILLISLLALLCFNLMLSVEQVTENYSNGMPKVIKTYGNYGKLELIKEIGYYSNGLKSYQTTFYKGKVKDTKRWSIDGVEVDWFGQTESALVFEVKTMKNEAYIISRGIKTLFDFDWYPAAVFSPSEGKLIPYGSRDTHQRNSLYSVFIEPNDPEFSCRSYDVNFLCEIYPVEIENLESIDRNFKLSQYQLDNVERKISKDAIRSGQGAFYIKTSHGNSIIRILNFDGERMENGHFVFEWKKIPE
ncbi:MAG: hypothetical protein CMF45_03565 [Legionellales bacterium]|nr:hypothetical protein [Legionellales bacterium]|tara:strand:- start:754 stop:1497 length:744 start_codon:yes stop_codon:yes gene_type:complete